MTSRQTRILPALLGTAAVGLLGGACALGPVSHAPLEFDSGALNAVWSPGYQRALPADLPPRRAESAARSERPPARSERAPSEAAREPERAATPPPASTARRPASTDTRFDPELAAAYVVAVYTLNETSVATTSDPGIVDIYRHAQTAGAIYHTPRPAVGDLIFFHNTFDRNGDGRNNDWYTHIGIVEDVQEDGTVAFLSYMAGEVQRGWMNLEAPDTARRNGREINTTLRTPGRNDPEHTQHLAGELFAGFGSLLGDREEVVVIDNWQPGSTVNLQATR